MPREQCHRSTCDRVSLAALYPYVMSEPTENSEGTVRPIGRPFKPGQSGNPGGDPKALRGRCARCVGVRPSRLPVCSLRSRLTQPRVTQTGSLQPASCSTAGWARQLGSLTSREQTRWSRTRSRRPLRPWSMSCRSCGTHSGSPLRSVPTYRLHDTTGDDLGLIEHPAPNVEPGDVVMLADGREALVTARVEARVSRSRRCSR